MQRNESTVEGAVSQSTQVADVLEKIVENVEGIVAGNQRIANSANEQQKLIADMHSNISVINETGEKTTQAAQDTKQASHHLAGLTKDLNSRLAKFRTEQ